MRNRRFRSRRRYRFVILALVTAGALTLTGCGETLEERIANRDACEGAGGSYHETINAYWHTYQGWYCILSTKED